MRNRELIHQLLITLTFLLATVKGSTYTRPEDNRVVGIITWCDSESFNISVETEREFGGAIYSKDFPIECSSRGNGTKLTHLQLPLNACGIDIIENDRGVTIKTILYVQFDEWVQQVSDEQLGISCVLSKSTNQTSTINVLNGSNASETVSSVLKIGQKKVEESPEEKQPHNVDKVMEAKLQTDETNQLVVTEDPDAGNSRAHGNFSHFFATNALNATSKLQKMVEEHLQLAKSTEPPRDVMMYDEDIDQKISSVRMPVYYDNYDVLSLYDHEYKDEYPTNESNESNYDLNYYYRFDPEGELVDTYRTRDIFHLETVPEDSQDKQISKNYFNDDQSNNKEEPIKLNVTHSRDNEDFLNLNATQSRVNEDSIKLNVTPSHDYEDSFKLNATHSRENDNSFKLNTSHVHVNKASFKLNATHSREKDNSFKLNATHSRDNEDFFKLNATQSPVNEDFFKLNATYSPVNEEFFKLNATHSPVNEEFFKLNATHSPVNEEFFKLNATHSPVNEEFFKLNATHSPVNEEFFNKNSSIRSSPHEKKSITHLQEFESSVKNDLFLNESFPEEPLNETDYTNDYRVFSLSMGYSVSGLEQNNTRTPEGRDVEPSTDQPVDVNITENSTGLSDKEEEEENPISCWMEIMEGNSPYGNPITEKITAGDTATLVVKVEKGSEVVDTKVTSCYAHDTTEENYTDLIDENGCPVDARVIPALRRKYLDSKRKYFSFAVFKVFKFPESDFVHFKCTVLLCKGKCQKSFCGRGRTAREAPVGYFTFEENQERIFSQRRNKKSSKSPRTLKPIKEGKKGSSNSSETHNIGMIVDRIDVFQSFRVEDKAIVETNPEVFNQSQSTESSNYHGSEKPAVKKREIFCLTSEKLFLAFSILAASLFVMFLAFYYWCVHRRTRLKKLGRNEWLARASLEGSRLQELPPYKQGGTFDIDKFERLPSVYQRVF